MSKTLISSCCSIHQLQYVQRKLDILIYPIGDWDTDSYSALNCALNKSYTRHIPCLYDHVEVTDDFKQSVRDRINTTLKQFLESHDFITTFPYFAAEYADVAAANIELVEYPAINSYTVRDVWDWAKFNIAQLNWIQFITFLVREETSADLNVDKIYTDRDATYAKLVSIANIIGDTELIKYSTSAHLKTFCIKPTSSLTRHAVMQLFTSVGSGFVSYETAKRQLFEDELHQLYTDFMKRRALADNRLSGLV